MENELCMQLNRALALSWYNPTQYDMSIAPNGGVYTRTQILSRTLIGELTGTPAFEFDMTHFDYITIDEDYVLDVSTVQPRSILTWVRSTYDSNKPPNCEVRMHVDEDTHETRVTLWSIERIDIDEELVY